MILFPIYGFINKHKNSAQMHRLMPMRIAVIINIDRIWLAGTLSAGRADVPVDDNNSE